MNSALKKKVGIDTTFNGSLTSLIAIDFKVKYIIIRWFYCDKALVKELQRNWYLVSNLKSRLVTFCNDGLTPKKIL